MESLPVPVVLIADDYFDFAEMTAELLVMLAPEPIAVTLAFNGAEAVAKAVEQKPKVVILDIHMPVMNGIDAARSIRGKQTPAPLLVAVTGNSQNLPALHDLKLFDQVLVKPVRVDDLVDLLQKISVR